MTWAYRDELSKRVTSAAEAVWTKLEDWRGLTPYDLGTSSPQRYDIGIPDPDAEVIERAVAQLPDAVIDWNREAYAILGNALALIDPCSLTPAQREEQSTQVRWRNRQGTLITAKLDGPRDVLLVRSLRTSALVTMHANAGTRPNWVTEQLRPQYVPAVKGPGPAIYGKCLGRHRYTPGSCCPLQWVPNPITVAEARADYLAWWRGLDQLAAILANQLEKFTPLAPAAPEMPWLPNSRQ